MSELLKPLHNWRVTLGVASLFFIGISPLADSVQNQVFTPSSLITITPALLVSGRIGDKGIWIGGAMGASIAPMLFLFATASIAKGGNLFPRWSVVLFSIVALAGFLWLGFGWQPTVASTSLTRALLISAQAVLPPIFLGLVVTFLRSSITASGAVAAHWLGFSWLTWSAIPWYGELL
jgi:hypothetical protein